MIEWEPNIDCDDVTKRFDRQLLESLESLKEALCEELRIAPFPFNVRLRAAQKDMEQCMHVVRSTIALLREPQIKIG
jgi:hypothetical protein